MYSLLESCKLNNVNFGEYIEDILTRLMKGEKADVSFLPNSYVPRPKEALNITVAYGKSEIKYFLFYYGRNLLNNNVTL